MAVKRAWAKGSELVILSGKCCRFGPARVQFVTRKDQLEGAKVSGVGAYIILTREDAKELFAHKENEAVRKVVEGLRHSAKHRDQGLVLDCGLHWDPIQRALTAGKLDAEDGDFPLDHCVLGGKQLHAGEGFDAVLIRPDIVPHVTTALHELRRESFVDKYMAIDPADYGKTPNEQEADQVWSTLKLIRQMFEDAANEHAAVVFTVER